MNWKCRETCYWNGSAKVAFEAGKIYPERNYYSNREKERTTILLIDEDGLEHYVTKVWFDRFEPAD